MRLKQACLGEREKRKLLIPRKENEGEAREKQVSYYVSLKNKEKKANKVETSVIRRKRKEGTTEHE